MGDEIKQWETNRRILGSKLEMNPSRPDCYYTSTPSPMTTIHQVHLLLGGGSSVDPGQRSQLLLIQPCEVQPTYLSHFIPLALALSLSLSLSLALCLSLSLSPYRGQNQRPATMSVAVAATQEKRNFIFQIPGTALRWQSEDHSSIILRAAPH